MLNDIDKEYQKVWDAILEKDFQADVREIAAAHGWLVFCTYDARRSPAGEPDLRLIRPPRVLFVENKREKGLVTDKQAHAAQRLRECPGIEYYLWRPHDIDQIHLILA